MQKAPIGTVVYAKKHAITFRDMAETARTIVAHERKKTGMLVAVLDNGIKVSFGELTDIPCSKMECGNCKWHQMRQKDRLRRKFVSKGAKDEEAGSL